MEVGIVAQKGNAQATFLGAELRETLQPRVTVRLDAATAAALADGDLAGEADAESGDGVPVERMAAYDLVVSIGGDGTFLYAARGAGSTPVLGVNLGEVGFLNAVSPGEAVETVQRVVERFHETGEIPSRDVPRLEASGRRAGGEAVDGQATDGEAGWSLHPAINEVVVQGPQRGHGQGLEYEVRVDGRIFVSGHGDGVLVSTPTGSTAYNLSESGPLVHPETDALVVTEMCAGESMPPLVVPSDSTVRIRVGGAESGFVSSDSTRLGIDLPETVAIEPADEPARIAEPASDFFTALSKLD